MIKPEIHAMPLHDWTRVPSGLFHHFHQDWSVEIARRLNRGILPPGTAALVEQRSERREGDVLAIEVTKEPFQLGGGGGGGGVAVMEPVTTQIVRRTDSEVYADLANRIVIRHHLGRIVAVIEIVSPGNKDSRHALREFVEKTIQFLRQGIHVLAVDLFPPTPRDPAGIHKAIWDEFEDQPYTFPTGKDRILVSYKTGDEQAAYIEPIAVGDNLPDMPLFFTHYVERNLHVMVPLETTYMAAWEATPQALRAAVETGVLPHAGGD